MVTLILSWYRMATKLVAELLDGNCTGIYIPGERMLVPNNAGLYLELQKMVTIRDPEIV